MILLKVISVKVNLSGWVRVRTAQIDLGFENSALQKNQLQASVTDFQKVIYLFLQMNSSCVYINPPNTKSVTQTFFSIFKWAQIKPRATHFEVQCLGTTALGNNISWFNILPRIILF